MIPLRIAAALAAALFLAVVVVRCSGGGSGGDAQNSRALTISPAAVTLQPGESRQFSASIGGSSVAVVWSIDELSPKSGSIGQTGGLYTAPTIFGCGTSAMVTVRATTLSGPAAGGTATVTLTLGSALTFPPTPIVVKTGSRIQTYATGLHGLAARSSSSGTALYAVWTEDTTSTARDDVLFFMSTDCGDNFSPPVLLNSTPGEKVRENPSVGVDPLGSKIYVVWVEKAVILNPPGEVFFTQGDANGENFSPPVMLSEAGSDNFNPALTVDGSGTVYAGWRVNSDDEKLQNLKMRKKRTNDAAFSEIIAVTTEGNVSAQHSLSMASLGDGKVYFAWIFDSATTGRDVYFAKTEDGGRSFTSPKRVDDVEGNVAANNPSIAVDPSGNPYIVWVDGPRNGGPREIRLVKSTDGGSTFGPSIVVNDPPPLGANSVQNDRENPSIAIDQAGNIGIAWKDRREGAYDIYFARSTDGGTTFPNIQITKNQSSSQAFAPNLALDGVGLPYILWTGDNLRNASFVRGG